MSILKNQRVLITGGTGTFGHGIVEYLLDTDVKAIIILSRDELKQFNMSQKFKNHIYYKKLHFFLGDIRDKDRISLALYNVDIVFHAAALKRIDSIEYNPTEAIKTNIIGTQNLIEEAIKNKVKYFMSISTDKAVNPYNLYGGTKFCLEKLTIAANNLSGGYTKFSVSRYGNVMSSRGSVVHIFKHQIDNNKEITITDRNMTRFNITLNKAIEFVIDNINNMYGGEIFVPKLKSYKIMDIANIFSNKYKIIGLRDGEKLHEEMISICEARNTIIHNNKFIILTKLHHIDLFEIYKEYELFNKDSYNSLNNEYLTIDEIKQLL